MKKTECPKCGVNISNNNYEKHTNSCDGIFKKFVKRDNCIHCGKSWDELGLGVVRGDVANHSRWCKENPLKENYELYLAERRKFFIENCLEERNNSIKDAWKKGCYNDVDFGTSFRGRKHTEETKEKIRQKQFKLKYRRLRKKTINYRGIILDSTWESALAERLDDLKINWVRPEPIIWFDNKKNERFYYPDFYLTDFNLYLDPKNPAAMKNQEEKINNLYLLYSNIFFLKTLDECKKFEIPNEFFYKN
jgi:hypothetical protein